jgi:hypothetical protein
LQADGKLDITPEVEALSLDTQGERVSKALVGIRHYQVDVEREEWKWDTLVDLIETYYCKRGVVFYCNSSERVSAARLAYLESSRGPDGSNGSKKSRGMLF